MPDIKKNGKRHHGRRALPKTTSRLLENQTNHAGDFEQLKYKDSQFPTLKMPSDSAAKELLDGLVTGNLDDAAQRVAVAAVVVEHRRALDGIARRLRAGAPRRQGEPGRDDADSPDPASGHKRPSRACRRRRR